MAKGTKINNSLAIICCDAIVDALDSGTADPGQVIIYGLGTATEIPATASEAVDTASEYVELATCVLSATAFAAASEVGATAKAVADTIADDSSATSGTAAFFRGMDGDLAVVIQGTCGTGTDFDMVMNTTSIAAGATVAITSWYISVPEAGA